jgi:hypothetical protein
MRRLDWNSTCQDAATDEAKRSREGPAGGRSNGQALRRASLRRTAEELAAAGHLNEWGQPYNAMSISRMLKAKDWVEAESHPIERGRAA